MIRPESPTYIPPPLLRPPLFTAESVETVETAILMYDLPSPRSRLSVGGGFEPPSLRRMDSGDEVAGVLDLYLQRRPSDRLP